MNYKKIPYTTEWTEYPDLAPKFKSLGLTPNDPENIKPEYTSPAVKLPDGRCLMDSRKIAEELEKLHPEPSLHIDNGYTDRTQKLLGNIFAHLRFIAIPLVPVKYLNPPSQEYLYPLPYRVLKEIRFLFKSGICLTSPSVLTTPSNILIVTVPIPTILHGVSFPIKTDPLETVSYVENQS